MHIWNWQIIVFLWLKIYYLSQFITKMGFCCKIWSLMTLSRVRSVDREPIKIYCLQWQRANARANLWWRHEPFPSETSIAKALYWKSGGCKKVLVMLGYHSIQQMSSIQHDKSDFGINSPLTERRMHYDLCPVDSCVNLLSALESRNGFMSMGTSPHLRALLINNYPCGQQFS